MMGDDLFVIDRETRDAIVAYLSQKPYAEVSEGIAALMNLQALPEMSVLAETTMEEVENQ